MLSNRRERKRRAAVRVEAAPGPLGGRAEGEGFAVAGSAPFAGPLCVACTPVSRLRGISAHAALRGVLVLAPCADIHTWFISQSIDVAFVDAQGTVLEACRGLPPRKRKRCKGACFTLERWAEPDAVWYERGQTLALTSR